MNKEVLEILKVLKDVNLDWVADEIKNAIQTGKTITKEIPEQWERKTKKATMTIPLTEPEQLTLSLRTIKTYFIELSEIWEKAKINFHQSDKLANVNIQISEPESKEPVELFEPLYKEQREKLLTLISEALK